MTRGSPRPTPGRASRGSRYALREREWSEALGQERQVPANTAGWRGGLVFSGSFVPRYLPESDRVEIQVHQRFGPRFDDGQEPKERLRTPDWPPPRNGTRSLRSLPACLPYRRGLST